MEEQLSIFNEFNSLDAERNIYKDFLSDDYRFEKIKSNKNSNQDEMVVVCNQSQSHLFNVTIKYNEQGMIVFHYNSVDGYWGSSYSTGNSDDIRKSIRNLVDDERSDRQIKKSL